MNREEIRNVFENLAKSQGLYGRVLENIDNSTPEEQETFWSAMESMNFKDSVDIVLYMES